MGLGVEGSAARQRRVKHAENNAVGNASGGPREQRPVPLCVVYVALPLCESHCETSIEPSPRDLFHLRAVGLFARDEVGPPGEGLEDCGVAPLSGELSERATLANFFLAMHKLIHPLMTSQGGVRRMIKTARQKITVRS